MLRPRISSQLKASTSPSARKSRQRPNESSMNFPLAARSPCRCRRPFGRFAAAWSSVVLAGPGSSTAPKQPDDSSFAGKHELVSVDVFENGRGSPAIFLRLFFKLHALGLHRLRRSENVVAPERNRLKIADAVFMRLRREERQSRFCPGDQQLDPSLLFAKKLVGSHLESQLLGKEFQRNVLIAHRYAHKFESTNHFLGPPFAADSSIAHRILQLQSAKHSHINHWYSDADFRFLSYRYPHARLGRPRPPPGQLSGLFVAFDRAAKERRSDSNQLPGTCRVRRCLQKFGAICGRLADSSSITCGDQAKRHRDASVPGSSPLGRPLTASKHSWRMSFAEIRHSPIYAAKNLASGVQYLAFHPSFRLP